MLRLWVWLLVRLGDGWEGRLDAADQVLIDLDQADNLMRVQADNLMKDQADNLTKDLVPWYHLHLLRKQRIMHATAQ